MRREDDGSAGQEKGVRLSWKEVSWVLLPENARTWGQELLGSPLRATGLAPTLGCTLFLYSPIPTCMYHCLPPGANGQKRFITVTAKDFEFFYENRAECFHFYFPPGPRSPLPYKTRPSAGTLGNVMSGLSWAQASFYFLSKAANAVAWLWPSAALGALLLLGRIPPTHTHTPHLQH